MLPSPATTRGLTVVKAMVKGTAEEKKTVQEKTVLGSRFDKAKKGKENAVDNRG